MSDVTCMMDCFESICLGVDGGDFRRVTYIVINDRKVAAVGLRAFSGWQENSKQDSDHRVPSNLILIQALE